MKPAYETADELSKRLGLSIDILEKHKFKSPRYAKIDGKLIFPRAGVTPEQFQIAVMKLAAMK